MKKILVVGPSLNSIGGISIFLNGLLNSDLKEKFDFIYFDCFFLKKRKESKSSSFSIKQLLKSLKLSFFLIRTIRQKDPELIYLNSSSFWGFWEKSLFILICNLLSKKVVLTVHGGLFVDFYKKSRYKKNIIGFLNRCNKVSFVSYEMFVFFKDKIQTKMVFIPVPVTFSLNYNSQALDNKIVAIIEGLKGIYKHTFFSVSILEKTKRIEEIIEVFKDTPKESHDVCLVVAGDGSLKNKIENISKKIKNVIYIGKIVRDTKSYIFDSLDCFIMNSEVEGFGITIVEALLARKLLLTTDVGVVKNEKDNLKSIVLMENGFNREVLKKSLFHLNHCNKNVEIDSEYIKKYTWKKLSKDYINFFWT